MPLAALAQRVRDEPPARVALLNVAGDQSEGHQIALALRKALLADDQFDPIQPGPLANVLEKALDEDPAVESARKLERIDEQIQDARNKLTQLEESEAERVLNRADRTLMKLLPTAQVLSRLAEVNFQLGRIYLRRSDPSTAIDSFRVVMRLQPDRDAPDPGKYDPDVIQAWKTASGAQLRSAQVRVTSPYDNASVYIDGVKVGVTPHQADVEPGPHYFYATLEDMQPVGRRATAIFKEPRDIEMSITRLPADALAAQAKRGLLTGELTDLSLGETAREIYDLNRVKYVIVIADRDPTGYSASVFDHNGRRVTKWVEIDEKSAADVVVGLPGRVDLDPRSDPTPDAGPINGNGSGNDTPRPWWKDPIAYAAITGGTLIIVVGVLILIGGDELPPLRPDVDLCGFDCQ